MVPFLDLVALVEVAGLGTWEAFAALLGGWLVMLPLQWRAGQPLMRLGPAHNCAQDSNLALFAAIRDLDAEIRGADAQRLQRWRERQPEQAERLVSLLRLERILRGRLLPVPPLRDDWRRGSFRLGSWRSLLPRLACETVLKVFLELGASALVLRANQLGGRNPRITPVAPFTLGC